MNQHKNMQKMPKHFVSDHDKKLMPRAWQHLRTAFQVDIKDVFRYSSME